MVIRTASLLASIALLTLSCQSKQPQNAVETSSPKPATANRIEYIGKDTTFYESYVIKLPEGYKIDPQPGADNKVFYFTPIDTTVKRGEAGIYFGARPDDSSPSTGFSKKEFPGIFLGQSVTWIEYTTDSYTQRETFIEIGPEKKIHCWCYSNNTADLEVLFEMIKTIRR
jgi:hypothetical protein